MNGCTVEVWKLIYHFISHLEVDVITYHWWDLSYSMCVKGHQVSAVAVIEKSFISTQACSHLYLLTASRTPSNFISCSQGCCDIRADSHQMAPIKEMVSNHLHIFSIVINCYSGHIEHKVWYSFSSKYNHLHLRKRISNVGHFVHAFYVLGA